MSSEVLLGIFVVALIVFLILIPLWYFDERRN